MFKVYVAEKSYEDYKIEREIIEQAGGRLCFAHCHTENDIIAQCNDADGLLLRQTAVGHRVFQKLRNLKVIARYGIGYDNVDVAAATRYGVVVTIVPDYCVEEVADHAIALLLAAIRKIPQRHYLVKNGRWDVTNQLQVYRTRGTIMGFVGYGKTAREVRKRMNGFPLRFVAYDPYIPQEIFINDATISLSFRKLLLISHYISIHIPFTHETHYLFNRKVFPLMRRKSILINTSRGGIVDQNALYTAISSGFIGGAGLDVFEDEPVDPGHPLFSLNSVVFSDHAAWYSVESLKELQAKTAHEAARVLTGHIPQNPVNPEVLGQKIIHLATKRKHFSEEHVLSKLIN